MVTWCCHSFREMESKLFQPGLIFLLNENNGLGFFLFTVLF